MKNKYFMLAGLVVLIGALVSFSVYAEKEHKAKKIQLPEPVTAAVESMYPQARIEEVERDSEGVMLYEIEVVKDGAEYELSIAPDGTVVEEETEIDMAALPEAIQQAIAGADVDEVTEEVTYWAVKLVKLDVPEVSYSVELKKGGEMEFSSDGTLVKQEMSDDDGDNDEHHKGAKGDDDDDDDDDGEEEDD
jgi:hypothetical protein